MRKRPHPTHRRLRVDPLRLATAWLSHHFQGALASLGRLSRSPLPTTMTVAVIAIALALPAGLYVFTRNLGALSEGWTQTAAISLFLKVETDIEQARALAAELQARPDMEQVTLIGPDEALAELGGYGGFGEAIAQLEENPLPAVLALKPASGISTPEALEHLSDELTKLPQADFARLDTQWVRRFQAILSLAERGVILLGGALALAVLLVVGNTIRLEIENRRGEIGIMELVGATPAFIRRPFLYTGCWYGLLGGIGAWLLVSLAVILTQGPVSRLAALYHTQFPLSGMGANAVLAMLCGSLFLGLAGSWVAVERHLTAAEPR
jgi:cell division transport system permease protein